MEMLGTINSAVQDESVMMTLFAIYRHPCGNASQHLRDIPPGYQNYAVGNRGDAALCLRWERTIESILLYLHRESRKMLRAVDYR